MVRHQGTVNACVKSSRESQVAEIVCKQNKNVNHPFSRYHEVSGSRFKLHRNATNTGNPSTDMPGQCHLYLKTEK